MIKKEKKNERPRAGSAAELTVAAPLEAMLKSDGGFQGAESAWKNNSPRRCRASERGSFKSGSDKEAVRFSMDLQVEDGDVFPTLPFVSRFLIFFFSFYFVYLRLVPGREVLFYFLKSPCAF